MPFIANTTITEYINSSGKLVSYRITPNTGYVLHTTNYDEHVIDEETFEETGEVILGFTPAQIGVLANYDFDNVVAGTYTYTDENDMEVTINISKVGRFEIYALPASIVPENQIFGDTDPDHEVM